MKMGCLVRFRSEGKVSVTENQSIQQQDIANPELSSRGDNCRSIQGLSEDGTIALKVAASLLEPAPLLLLLPAGKLRRRQMM
jgi:hypothetical protein